jgi:hypothetical protein
LSGPKEARTLSRRERVPPEAAGEGRQWLEEIGVELCVA